MNAVLSPFCTPRPLSAVWCAGVLLLHVVIAAVRAAEGEEGVAFFEKKIRPLLAERCHECHSAEAKKLKGGLRLDTRDGWAIGGESGPEIVPGDPEASRLIRAVRYTDRDLKMPPKGRLPDAEVKLLEQWVKMGAPDPRTVADGMDKPTFQKLQKLQGEDHWAFKPVGTGDRGQRTEGGGQKAETGSAVDAFIRARLAEKNLPPAPRADSLTLVRRVHYALTGLPPTPEEAEAFQRAAVRDSQSAIESLVDRQLASPQFGEQWARHWLDVARFAESSGGGRTLPFKDAWRYRDFVIAAFNSDMPFDQFIREQIAGDLLPAADAAARRRQIIATGFLALGPTNYEEQDKQQLRMDIIDEQLDTLGKGFLGMTLGCARCHDHKFDPVPTRDYYALAGIFRGTRTLRNYTDNVAHWVDSPLPLDASLEEKLREHEGRVALLEVRVKEAKRRAARATAGTASASDMAGKPITADLLPGIIVDDTQAKLVGEWRLSQRSKSYIGEGYQHDDNADKGTKTATFAPRLPRAGRYEVRLAYITGAGRATNVPVTILHADGEQHVHVNQQEPPPVDGRFVSLGRFRFEQNGEGYVLVGTEGTRGHVTADAVQFLPLDALAVADAPATVTNKSGADTVVTEAKRLEKELKELKQSGPQRPVAMSVAEGDAGDTHVLVRGNIRNPGARVPRGFLAAATHGGAPAIPAGESGRRQLAEWIASPRNPLTARVAVNRVWHWLFGAGLVRTTDNLGTMGEAPSHPELLDHLAARFVEEGWSVKKLVRELVLTETWQQASFDLKSEISNRKSADPDNRLLSRANRRRMDAEELRDTLLVVSGRLVRDVGGPGIAGAGEADANTTETQNLEYGYKFTDTRRSLYTPAFRNNRLELFNAFDGTDPNVVTGRRNVSTVAPQALYMMNHPFVLEHARAAARSALAESAGEDAERVRKAYVAAFTRAPTPGELVLALEFVGGAPADAEQRVETWARFFQALFASVDFRHVN